MHRDFLTVLLQGEGTEDIRYTYQRLCDIENEACRKAKEELWNDVLTCDHVIAALREPANSAPYLWAQSFLEEAREAEKKKPPRQIAFELRRREIEYEFIRLKEQENERMKQAIEKRLEEDNEPSTPSAVSATGEIIKRRV